MLILGRQVNWLSNQSIENLAEEASNHGLSTIQIMFNEDPHRPYIRPISPISKPLAIPIIVHGKYLYNSCRSIATQEKLLMSEIIQANQINSPLIIHQGHNVKDLHLTHEQAVHASSQYIATILFKMKNLGLKNKLLLENSCHEGTAIGWDVDDLLKIREQIEPEFHQYLGTCLDTCHAFQAGVCDFQSAAETIKFLESWEKKLKTIDVIHLNDSKSKFCEHVDRHGNILAGHIMNPYLSGNPEGIQALLIWAQEKNIPIILETPFSADPKHLLDELQVVRDLAAKRSYTWYLDKYVAPPTPPPPLTAPLIPTLPSPKPDDNELIVNPLTNRVITKATARKIGII